MLVIENLRHKPQPWRTLFNRVDCIKNSIADLRTSKEALSAQIELLKTKLDKAQSEISQLRIDNEQIQSENKSLKEKNNELKASLLVARSAIEHKTKKEGGPTLQFKLPRDEKYPNETLCHIMALIFDKLKEAKKKSNSPFNRELDIFLDFLSCNSDSVEIYNQKKSDVNELINFAKKESYLRSPKAQKLLKKFGMSIRECTNGHWRVFFEGDDRYLSSEAGTGSSGCRGGKNEASYFIHAMLF